MKRLTDFDRYLEEQLEGPHFAARFKEAGEAWDVAMQLAALRKEFGLSQNELAKRVGTSQQQISRLESPGYGGSFPEHDTPGCRSAWCNCLCGNSTQKASKASSSS